MTEKKKVFTTPDVVKLFHPGWNLLKPEYFNSQEHAHLFVVLEKGKRKRRRIFGREVMSSSLRYFVVCDKDLTITALIQEKKEGQYEKFAQMDANFGKEKPSKEKEPEKEKEETDAQTGKKTPEGKTEETSDSKKTETSSKR